MDAYLDLAYSYDRLTNDVTMSRWWIFTLQYCSGKV